MVLLVLAIIWGVLLVSWLRSRSDDSVRLFRRHLYVLQRVAPATMTPANRLRSGPVAGGQPHLSGQHPLYRQPVRPGGRAPGSVVGATGAPGIGLRPPLAAAIRHRRVQRRRRDVFFALLAGVVGTLLVALVLKLRVMWGVQVAIDSLFLAYVALLIRVRNLAAERAMKLAFMSPRHLAGRRPPVYDLSEGYGELSLPQAAN